jgi:hypothetical protein
MTICSTCVHKSNIKMKILSKMKWASKKMHQIWPSHSKNLFCTLHFFILLIASKWGIQTWKFVLLFVKFVRIVDWFVDEDELWWFVLIQKFIAKVLQIECSFVKTS